MTHLGEGVHEEALRHFRALLAIDTTNPPGNEIAAARYLEDVLAADGLAATVFEPFPARASLIARQKASSAPATGGPLLLTSHTDVVEAEAGAWRHPPFSGAVADGCVWGRGAVDMKSMTIYGLMAFLLARREGWPLSRDLVLAAVADEEAGGDRGMRWLVENAPDAIRAEFALNEVGGFSIDLGDRRVYPVQVAEKGVAWFRLVAKGDPGHGSIPRRKTSIRALIAALGRLTRRPLPFHVTGPAARFIRALASASGPVRGLVLKGLLVPGVRRISLALLSESRRAYFTSLLSNTANPTGLSAGSKENVVPSRAEAVIDGRLVPGETLDGYFDEIRERVGPDFDLVLIRHLAPDETSPDTPLFDLIRETLEQADPGCAVVPSLLAGYTDAAHLSRLGVRTYGFAPMKLPQGLDFAALFHGHDERLPIESFRFGLEAFVEVVRRFTTGAAAREGVTSE